MNSTELWLTVCQSWLMSHKLWLIILDYQRSNSTRDQNVWLIVSLISSWVLQKNESTKKLLKSLTRINWQLYLSPTPNYLTLPNYKMGYIKQERLESRFLILKSSGFRSFGFLKFEHFKAKHSVFLVFGLDFGQNRVKLCLNWNGEIIIVLEHWSYW